MELVPPPSIKRMVRDLTGQSAMSGTLNEGSTSNTPWRKSGVKYATNEIYFDLVEEIDATIEANGLPAHMEVSGEIQVSCKLSGMPDLTLSFMNAGILDDVSFHPCVRYVRFEQHKVVSFVPPDGNFKLMNYRVKGQLQLPLYVKPQINFTNQSGRVNVMVGSKTNQVKSIEDIVITIPFPRTVSSTTLTANVGQVQFDEMTKVCKWIIGRLPKEKTPMLEGSVQMQPGSSTNEGAPTIQAYFKCPMYAASGLKIDTLALLNERYKPYKGVRAVTKAGKFQVRGSS